MRAHQTDRLAIDVDMLTPFDLAQLLGRNL
jgi:hypothetical protein